MEGGGIKVGEDMGDMVDWGGGAMQKTYEDGGKVLGRAERRWKLGISAYPACKAPTERVKRSIGFSLSSGKNRNHV